MLIDTYSKSTFKSRMTLMAVICGITALATYGWLVQPHVNNLQAAQKFINGSDSFVKKARTVAGMTQIKKIEVDRLVAELESEQKQFFTPESLQAFFTNLETLATQTQCTVTSVKLLADNEEASQTVNSGMDQCRAGLTVRGHYTSIAKFMNELLHQPKQISISGLRLSARPEDNHVDCSMAIGMYVIDTKGADVNEK